MESHSESVFTSMIDGLTDNSSHLNQDYSNAVDHNARRLWGETVMSSKHIKQSPLTDASAMSHDPGVDDVLPLYSCSVELISDFDYKPEMISPFTRSSSRKWSHYIVELVGTLLKIYKTDRPVVAVRSSLTANVTRTANLIKSYTLQGATCGIAKDYPKDKKRPYVLRLRAEGEQFILATTCVKKFKVWLEAFPAAIGLSLPLESRKLPDYPTLPRRVPRDGSENVLVNSELSSSGGDILWRVFQDVRGNWKICILPQQQHQVKSLKTDAEIASVNPMFAETQSMSDSLALSPQSSCESDPEKTKPGRRSSKSTLRQILKYAPYLHEKAPIADMWVIKDGKWWLLCHKHKCMKPLGDFCCKQTLGDCLPLYTSVPSYEDEFPQGTSNEG